MKKKQTIVLHQIRRAVATSTAIETGTPAKQLEALLTKKHSRFQHLKLAN